MRGLNALYGFSSVRRRFDSFSICFSLSITSLGSMPLRTLATSVGMVCAVRGQVVGVSLQLSEIEASRWSGRAFARCRPNREAPEALDSYLRLGNCQRYEERKRYRE